MRSHPHRRAWPPLALLALTALVATACSVSNDDIDANEFIRPPAPGLAGIDDRDTPTPGGAPEGVVPEPATPATPAGPIGDTDDLDLAEGIVRRYRNPTYGYSLELVCPPFCDVNPGGIDRVRFDSDTPPASLTVAVRPADEAPTLARLEGVWLESVLLGAVPTILDRREVTLPFDAETPALLIEWEVDTRATGGSQARWRSLLTVVGPIAYFINAGSVVDSFDALAPDLQQALDSFLALPDPPNRPGSYTRFGFSIRYNVDDLVAEAGVPALVGTQPTADLGAFILRPRGGASLILTWEALSEAIYDADAAIDAESRPPGAVSVEETLRGAFDLSDDIRGRVATFTAADAAGNVVPLRVFSWYCLQGGRAFTLQSLSDVERPDLLDNFRCGPASDEPAPDPADSDDPGADPSPGAEPVADPQEETQ